MATNLNLYTYKPPNTILCDDEYEDKQNFYIQGILESLYDPNKTKFACFLELFRQHNLLIKKLKNDLIDKTFGNYYRHHILLDVINLYTIYHKKFDNINDAFDIELMQLCYDTVTIVFELFNCATNLTIFVKNTANDTDITMQLLNDLQKLNILTIIKIVSI